MKNWKWFHYIISLIVVGFVIVLPIITCNSNKELQRSIEDKTQRIDDLEKGIVEKKKQEPAENRIHEMNPILLKSVEHECLGFLGSRTNQNDSAKYFRNVGLDVVPYLVEIANFEKNGNLTPTEKGARVGLMYVFEYRIKKTNDELKKRIMSGDLEGVDVTDIFTETFGFQTKLGILDKQPNWVTGYPLLPVDTFVDDDMEKYIDGHSCSKQCNRHRR
ncbi:MAG: hypothetical protein ABH828_00500 [archaeon]